MTRTYVTGDSAPKNPWKTDEWVFEISDIREEPPVEHEGTEETTRQWSFIIDRQYTYPEYTDKQDAALAEAVAAAEQMQADNDELLLDLDSRLAALEEEE